MIINSHYSLFLQEEQVYSNIYSINRAVAGSKMSISKNAGYWQITQNTADSGTNGHFFTEPLSIPTGSIILGMKLSCYLPDASSWDTNNLLFITPKMVDDEDDPIEIPFTFSGKNQSYCFSFDPWNDQSQILWSNGQEFEIEFEPLLSAISLRISLTLEIIYSKMEYTNYTNHYRLANFTAKHIIYPIEVQGKTVDQMQFGNYFPARFGDATPPSSGAWRYMTILGSQHTLAQTTTLYFDDINIPAGESISSCVITITNYKCASDVTMTIPFWGSSVVTKTLPATGSSYSTVTFTATSQQRTYMNNHNVHLSLTFAAPQNVVCSLENASIDIVHS